MRLGGFETLLLRLNKILILALLSYGVLFAGRWRRQLGNKDRLIKVIPWGASRAAWMP